MEDNEPADVTTTINLGLLDESSIDPIIDSHSVEWLKGYQQAIIEYTNVKVRTAINDGQEDLMSADILGVLIDAKEKREETNDPIGPAVA